MGPLTKVPKPRRQWKHKGRGRRVSSWRADHGEIERPRGGPLEALREFRVEEFSNPCASPKALLTRLLPPCSLGPMCLCSCAIFVSPEQMALKRLLTGSLGRA